MKLVSLATLLGFVLIKAQSQKIHHEQLPLPPQYQRPFNGAFQSEGSLYLPPESNSPLPYFPMKNIDKLQFQYLPASGTKAPPIYQTAFPLIVSSIPNFDDDDSNDGDDDNDNRGRSTPQTPENNQSNRTQNQGSNKKDIRSLPTVSYRHPIDRADNMKFPFQMGNFGPPPNQVPQNRRMIISSETKRSDHVPDQIKTASFQGNHYIPPPLGFTVSTTEPAIPILRLSNEMDLDGSYSYEALGADQTHYVQHSRMENMGTEKEEQVVEGSYSYVGDNGQTYTVHYVADSNGFRASGDHLPVAPPVPEIIQRAVQYNLAEEAKRPPHLKQSWQDDERDNSYFEKEKNTHFVLPAQTPHPPPRNLFTGRQPEAFSYSFSHERNQDENNNNNNNLATAASNQVSVKTVDFKKEQNQNKPNAGPITPQITFLASQGAHVPALNAPPQPSISRMNMFANERLPQLINYEAALKDNEPEAKGLWRWQYGINSNNNETPAKATISRSSGDDIIINFSDMTPEQYTSMLRSDVDTNSNYGNGVEQTQQEQNVTVKNYHHAINEYDQQYQNQQYQYQNYQMQQQNDMEHHQHEFATQKYTRNLPKQQTESIHHKNSEPYQNQNFNYQQTQQQQNDLKQQQHEFATQQYTQNLSKQQSESIHQKNSEPSPNQNYNYQQAQQQQNDMKRHQHEFATQQTTKNLLKQQTESVQQSTSEEQMKSEIVQPYQNQYYNYQQSQPSQNAQQLYQPTATSFKAYPESTVTPFSSTSQAPVTQNVLKRDPQLQIVNNNYQNQQQQNLRPSENVRTSESRHLIPANHHQGILTRHHFVPPSQTITQSYDYEDENMSFDDFYEARKMKSYNLDTLKILSSTMMPMSVQTMQSQYEQTLKSDTENQQAQYPLDQTYSAQNMQNDVQTAHPVYEHSSLKVEPYTEEVKTSPSPVYIPSSTTKASFKFSDFIVKEEEGFSPVTNPISEPKDQTTTTTESSIEEMFENNIFLKNMFSVNKNEANKQNSFKEEVKTDDHPKTQIAESKSDKPSKQTFSKAFQYTKTSNKKPVDISQVLHYVAHKNGFEPIKIKPKSKPVENHSQQQHSEQYYINSAENKNHEREQPKNSLSPRQHEELRGVIKNYKVLQRNNNPNSQQIQYKPEFNQPLRLLELQPPNTPPLGRAGPTVKAYLPPIYV